MSNQIPWKLWDVITYACPKIRYSKLVKETPVCCRHTGRKFVFCFWVWLTLNPFPSVTLAVICPSIAICKLNFQRYLLIKYLNLVRNTEKFGWISAMLQYLQYNSNGDTKLSREWLGSETGKSHFDGLMQERGNSIANTLQLCFFCTNPSIFWSTDAYYLWLRMED